MGGLEGRVYHRGVVRRDRIEFNGILEPGGERGHGLV
jgi:hypothetical protein